MVDQSQTFFSNENISAPTIPVVLNPLPPDTVINGSANKNSQINLLSFPAEKIKYYMDIHIGDYKGSIGGVGAFGTGALVNTTTAIRLPLPIELKDVQSENWTQANLLEEAFAVGGDLVKALAFVLAGKGAGQSVAAGAEAGGLVAGLGLTARAGLRALGDLARLGGISPNQFITILFNSPEYKQHTFTWTLSAKTPGEAETLRKIIQLLNNAMAPGLAPSKTYWTFPSIFQIYFAPCALPYLYQFKPAVLVKFAVDYAGGHVPSFRRADTATQGLNPPEALILQMQFLEIEYWKNGDFGGGTEAGVRTPSAPLSQKVIDSINFLNNQISDILKPYLNNPTANTP